MAGPHTNSRLIFKKGVCETQWERSILTKNWNNPDIHMGKKTEPRPLLQSMFKRLTQGEL